MAKRSKRPTIIDIARQAGVSFKTVSRVLNNNPHVGKDLRERVLKASADLDYRPNLAARSLAGPRNYSIALLIPIRLADMQGDDDWYLPAFLSDLQFAALLACQKLGYRLSVEICDVSAGAAPPAVPAGILRGEYDGVMIAPPLCDRPELVTAMAATGIPHVLIAPGLEAADALSVATDEYGGAAAMTRHLLELGHRRIAFVQGPEGHKAASARLKAYRDVLAQVDPALAPIVESGLFNFPSGYRAAEALLARDKPPTAIFCANDDMAAGAIAAATQRGLRVPDQLSIVGFDDSAIARLTWPPLTTVRQSLGAMAGAAVQLLTGNGEGASGEDRRHITLSYKLIERASARSLRG
ncbi:MAG TPA: LacI family DNA-binding transcriptional regulator [Sphingobium sp.]|nr:LacI family DNA-binding transcriptional regulator [Sphingobium sp.]